MIANFVASSTYPHRGNPKKIVHVTGFGPFKMYSPFKDIKVNPSELLARYLNNTFMPFNKTKNKKCFIFSSILNVTKEDVSMFQPHQDAIALIHLGFDDEMKGMGLEIMAENKLANTRTKPIINEGPKLLPTTVDLSRSFLGTPYYFHDSNI